MQRSEFSRAFRAAVKTAFAVARIAALFCCAVPGCSQKDWLQREVPAASSDELAAFRARLGQEKSADEIKPFDTALQELKLDAMNHGVAGVAAREAQMRAMVAGKPVRDVLVLGWEARQLRLENELKDMSGRLEHDSQLLNKPGGPGPTPFMTNLIKNEQDIVAQLKRDLAQAQARLAEWGVAAGDLDALTRARDGARAP